MTSDLTAQAIRELPHIFKIAVERKRGQQVLSVEGRPEGVIVEVITKIADAEYRVLTGRDTDSAGGRNDAVSVALHVNDELEGVYSWEHTPSGNGWQTSFEPDDGVFVTVVTPEMHPPEELRLTRTTIVAELPASFRP